MDCEGHTTTSSNAYAINSPISRPPVSYASVIKRERERERERGEIIGGRNHQLEGSVPENKLPLRTKLVRVDSRLLRVIECV